MRLKDFEIKVLKKIIQIMDNDAKLYLFGSRADDNKKGGDIDLLVLSDKLNFGDKLKIKRYLFKNLEEQKIDIIIEKDINKPFVKHIMKNAVLL